MNTTLDEIQEWYESQCDGDWEHSYGFHVKTLENPGWRVLIAVAETEWEDEPFSKLMIKRADDDWIHCEVKDRYFTGFGGPGNLTEIFEIFLRWVESPTWAKDQNVVTSLDRFQEWYKAQQEHYEITLDTLDNPGWTLKVTLTETKLNDKPFEKLEIDRTDDDWIHCRIKEEVFQAFSGPKNLEEILNTFLRWVES